MAVSEHTTAAEVVADRERYVARGVATTPLVVARAEGARLWDVDGREYVDFAGGLGCQNTGHGFAAAAIHEQVDRYLHQCFMVGMYEPYIEVCKLLDETWPAEGCETKSILLNSGAEAVENAVKIARTATGRTAVIVFDHAFHGRTSLTMAMTAKVVPYKQGFGPFPGDVYRAAAPYPYRGVSSDDAMESLLHLFKQDVDPATVACVVLEPVQGEGGFVAMPEDFPGRLKELCEEHGILYVDDEVQAGVGRTGPMWAIEHYGVEPDLIVSGKSLGGGLPLAAVTGSAELMDSVPPGGLGGTFGGNPLACVAAIEVLREVKSEGFRKRADELGTRIRGRLEQLAARTAAVGDVRGLGPMLAVELTEPTPELAKAVTSAARDRGLVLLSCGIYGNVIRILVPLTIDDALLERGLDLLEESLGDARAG
ncbi:MAG: 4-aminobutyrate aminotransferase / (S)-3-amino-2-methylpropionate transaminase / 5-aminovalerate [Pseudonocardiales bacterium]|nr:4-aminobutyrate aminotransferase / (S)-3-amino-2-methylpropionate transaminase / 5-aminovalerate [Pseudonocardiales bacterium]